MATIKAKNANGEWVNVSPINQVIEAPAAEKTWKEIEVTGTANRDWQEFDCSAAGINLLETDNWMLICNTLEYGTPYGFYAVASKYQPVIITPILARLQGEDMTDNFTRVGIYRPKLNGSVGYTYFGSEAYNRINYAVSMNTGVNTSVNNRIYKDIIYASSTYSNTAKLIYLS